jgi:hypothetical protein
MFVARAAAAPSSVLLVGAASIGGNAASLSCPKPGGTDSVTDQLIAWHTNDDGLYSSLTAAGWTLLAGRDQGTSEMHTKLWARLPDASASYAFATGSEDCCVTIATVRGAAPFASWIIPPLTGSMTNSTTRTAPSVPAGPTTGALLFSYASAAPLDTAATWTPPAGMTEIADVQSRTHAIHGVAVLADPPIPTGERTWTCSTSTFWNTSGGIGASVLIPPA